MPSSICHEEADDVSDQKNRSQKANAELLSSRNSHHWARLFGLLSNLPALNKWHPRRVDVIMLRRTLTEAPRSCHIAIPANHEVKDQIITKTFRQASHSRSLKVFILHDLKNRKANSGKFLNDSEEDVRGGDESYERFTSRQDRVFGMRGTHIQHDDIIMKCWRRLKLMSPDLVVFVNRSGLGFCRARGGFTSNSSKHVHRGTFH